MQEINGFDWDNGNKSKSLIKHTVTIEEAEQVFMDQLAMFFEDREHSDIELRFKVLGVTRQDRLLTVAFTIRNNKIRVVSARDMQRNERLVYD
jgi:uncharacterized protein